MTAPPRPSEPTQSAAAGWSVAESRTRPVAALSELVMAWATDAESGHPVYIEELPRERTGQACACLCPACGAELTARNAGKPIPQRRRRAHFAHSAGTATSRCALIAARLAALRALTEQNLIALPGRDVRAAATGLSGFSYIASRTVPGELAPIQSVDYQDATTALVTLGDGRTLRVEIVGSLELPEPGADQPTALVPTIRIYLDDPTLAELSADELRQRMKLAPDGTMCWMRHWQDDELRRQAEEEAQELAVEALDALGDAAPELDALPPELRRQGLLHALTLAILQQAPRVAVPGLGTAATSGASAPPPYLDIEQATAEPRIGQLIPDLILYCRQPGYERVLCEVTVTHGIDATKLAHLRALDLPVFELDFRLAGGKVTRAELHHLVVEDTRLKRWVCHPSLRNEDQAHVPPVWNVQSTPVRQLARPEWEFDDRPPAATTISIVHRGEVALAGSPVKRQWREMPDELLRKHYLDHIRRYGFTPSHQQQDRDIDSYALHQAATEELRYRGFWELGDPLLSDPGGLIEQLVSIQEDKVIGEWSYSPRTGAELIIFLSGRDEDAWRPFSTLLLIARDIYRPQENPAQTRVIDHWRARVLEAIKSGDQNYLRPRTYDHVLGSLFLAMATRLTKPFGRAPL